MIILGIDPGYAILGYGVINTDGIRSKAIDYGVIETVAHTPFPQRLERLYTCMNEPMQIKSAVTGNGHADKKQVQQMIKLLLSLNSIPKPDDAADALAAAL